jgi:hypothetical protein
MKRYLTAALIAFGLLSMGGRRGPDAGSASLPTTAVPETLTDEQLMWRARQFHGHLEPWLTLGIVMGQYAVERLGGQKYYKLNATVETDGLAPHVSILDGLQFSTGCTVGNRNLTVVRPSRSRAPIRVEFVGSRGAGDSVTLEVLPSIYPKCEAWTRSGEDEKVVFKRVYHMPVNQLFREAK